MVYNYAQREGIDWPNTPIYLFEPSEYNPYIRPFVLYHNLEPLDMFGDYEPRY